VPAIVCPHTEAWDGYSLDGLAGCWSPAGRVFLKDNVSGRPPIWGTEVRVGRHQEELLILFICQDPDPSATKTKRDDHLWEEDVVEVFIDPFGDLDCYFEFEVNPLNTELRRPAYGDRFVSLRMGSRTRYPVWKLWRVQSFPMAYQLLPDRAPQRPTSGTIGLVAYLCGDFSST
jgi:hypothetical protein